ncbi:MAG: CPBP family intramembrane metalloprotease [Muribaculaceae bacterium]|nr:CPBP family intramembrane metalloprotease [Muribaculaceae bacterium]
MFTFGKRLLLLVFLLIAGMALTGLFSSLISALVSDATKALRVTAIVQDLFGFILPAVVLAVMVTRLPADFLKIRGGGRRQWACAALTALAVVAAVPLINTLVEWNSSISLGPLHEPMTRAEAAAEAASELMLGGGSVADLLLGLLIVGVFAGFSEEIFFRGALQRLLITRPMNPHLAIWTVAFIFSAFHVQFFGFVPRLLLGALFGYAAWWSASLWPAVIGHVFNNSLTVIVMWLVRRGDIAADAGSFGAFSPLWLPASLILTAAVLWSVRRLCRR